jgi:uncharacterized protein (TIGR02099 family)
MTRSLRKLVKWFYFLIALALILLAVLVQSGRSFSHLLDSRTQDVADYFSTKLNAPVAIGQIEAEWNGLKPNLVIQDVNIKSQAGQPIVALKQARLRLDILKSLFNLRLVWSNLSLNQVEISFVQTDEGFWHIPGLPQRTEPDRPGAQLDALLDMLLLSTKIEFQSSHLSFHFTSGKQVILDSPYLLLENADDFHRLAVQIDVDEQARSVYLIVEGRGDPRDQQKFSSRGYVQLNRFPTDEPVSAASAFLLSGADKAGLHSEGTLDANIWFERRAGNKGYDLIGRLELQRLSLPLGERRLALDDFSTELSGFWLPSGEWRLGLQKINAAMEDQKIVDVNLAVASAGFKQPLQINLDKLDLGRIPQLLKNSGVLGDSKLHQVLTTLNPQGHLRNVQVNLPLQQPKDWQMRANLDQVGVSAWQGVPALVGVDGYLQAGHKGGFVDIDSQRFFSMHYSPLYTAPMEYDRAKGQVAWHLQPENNRIYVNSGQLEFHQGTELARGYMWLSLPWQRNTGDIDLYLQIGARQLNASRYQKYTPALLPPSLLSWLEQSIGPQNPGMATEAGFVYRGTLNTKNPMARTQQLYLDIQDAELNYHPGWPALSELDGRLLVSDSQVAASVTDAALYGSRVQQAEVRAKPRATGKGTLLEVDGEIKGAASDGIRVLREGMLRQYLGGSVDSWFIHGDMLARLDLDIPIGTGEQKPAGARQRVDVDLKAQRFELQNLNLVVDDLVGRISYDSNTGVSSNTLKARLFDELVEARLSTRKLDDYSKTLIELEGAVNAGTIAYWSKRPEVLFLKGNLPYQARVELNHRPRQAKNLVELSPDDATGVTQSAAEFAGQAFASVTITSRLNNVGVDLPAPYGKLAADERALEFILSLQESQAQVDVRYGDLQALLRTDRIRKNSLLNANIALATEARFSDQPQFLVSGFLPDINLDEWKAVLERYKAYGVRLTPVVTRALSSLQAPPRGLDPEAEPVGQIAGLPFRAELTLGKYEFGSTVLENLKVVAVPVRAAWQLEVENTIVAGKLLVPDNRFTPLQADLSRLSLSKAMLEQDEPANEKQLDPTGASASTASVKPVEVIDPSKLPLANISVAALMMDDKNYGKWSLQVRPNDKGVVIDNIRGSMRSLTVTAADNPLEGARLIWQNTPVGVQTRFIGSLSAGNVAEVLRAWEKPDTLESKSAHFRADLFWPGSPQDFKLVNLGGEMGITIEKGSFKREASAGEGVLRLMSLLNFDTLARRMQLDFSDLYKSGLAYDEIKGKVRFNQGTLLFEEPLLVRTASSRLQMAGTINLRDETINTRLVATLPVAGNLTFFAALATGLPAAAGVYLVSKLFKKQVDQATSISYTITGGWDDPVMSFDRLFESERSLRDSVTKKQAENSSSASDS